MMILDSAHRALAGAAPHREIFIVYLSKQQPGAKKIKPQSNKNWSTSNGNLSESHAKMPKA